MMRDCLIENIIFLTAFTRSVQDMNRTLERRVVAAKEFFANEISAATANEQRYRRELKQVEQREEVLRQKHEELINSSRTQIDRLTERLDEVETSNAAMRSAEERSRGDIESTLHEQLETQRVKHSR